MMTVLSLKKSKKSYTVTFKLVDNSSVVFLVSEDIVVEYRLIPGKILEDFAFQSFKKAVDIDDIFQKTKNYALRYPQTLAGMEKYLETRLITTDKIGCVIDKLKENGILNDEIYAKNYVENHFRFHHEGKIKIRFDLRQKGVSETIIDKAIQVITDQAEIAAMKSVFDRKQSTLKNKPLHRGMMLMKEHLVAKGYDRESAEAFVIARAGLFHSSTDELSLIKKDYKRLCKQLGNPTPLDYSQKSKIVRSLMAKGYSYATIKSQIESGPTDD